MATFTTKVGDLKQAIKPINACSSQTIQAWCPSDRCWFKDVDKSEHPAASQVTSECCQLSPVIYQDIINLHTTWKCKDSTLHVPFFFRKNESSIFFGELLL